jgi:hypothetical protein
MKYLAGPELFWLILYAAAALLGRVNSPPSRAIDDFIDKLWILIPLASLLVFGLWWIPGVEKNWLSCASGFSESSPDSW